MPPADRREGRHAGRAGSRPAAALRALAVALGLALTLTLAAGPAAAQAIDLRGLFGGSAPPPAGAPAEAAPPERERPPELAVYGDIAAAEVEATMVRRTTENVGVFRQRLERVLREAPRGAQRMLDRLEEVSPDGTAGYFAGVALVTAVLILIGRGFIALLAVYAFRPLMVRAQRGPPPRTLGDKLPVLALRMAITVVAVGVNALVVLGLGLGLVQDHAPTQGTAVLILGAYSLYVLVDTAWRMVLSPYLSAYRIPALTDTQARSLYLWITSLAAFGIASHAYVAWMREMGVLPELVTLNDAGFGLASMVLALVMIWRNRAGVTRAILRGRPREEASWIAAAGARLWAPAATLYFLAAGIEETVRVILGLDKVVPLLSGVFITLMLGLVVHAAGLFAVERLFARPRAAAALREEGARRERAEREAERAHAARRSAGADSAGGADGGDDGGDDEGGGGPPPEALHRPEGPGPQPAPPRRPSGRMSTYEQLAARVVSLFAIGTATYVMVWIWAGSSAFADGAPLDVIQDAFDTLFLGYVAYHAARIWLDRKIAEEVVPEHEAELGDEGGGSAASRLGTLLPLFRSGILVTIGLSVALLVAMEFGVNVAPLFAGAGIVGLAVGFGAQTLVRDILSGVFFLLDDAFRKGEYIDVGQVKGTVEKISLRSFQLRHHLGALHTIPFGEIQHLTNFSRDWVMMKLPLRVTYDTDVEEVRKLIKKLGQELLAHPTEGPKFVQPLKSQGVYMMDDSAMIIRVKYMTRPGDQWTTRKLVYQRLREIFAESGIKFAHREVTVRMPDLGDRALSPDEMRAVGAAARRAVDEAEAAAGGRPSPLAAVEGR